MARRGMADTGEKEGRASGRRTFLGGRRRARQCVRAGGAKKPGQRGEHGGGSVGDGAVVAAAVRGDVLRPTVTGVLVL